MAATVERSSELQAAAVAELLTEEPILSMHRCPTGCCIVLYTASSDEFLIGVSEAGHTYQIARGALADGQWRPQGPG